MRGDSDVVEAVRLLARCHQGLIWARQRHLNQVRTALREFYPGALAAFGTDLARSQCSRRRRRPVQPAS